MTSVLSKYHLVRDRHDERDLYVHQSPSFKLMAPASLPESVNLQKYCSPVVDQGDLGSCTANAITAAMEFLENQAKEFETPAGAFVRLSRLFLYYNERMVEGDINQDDGAQICDGVASTKNYGVATEITWPYSVQKFATTPSTAAYAEALTRRTSAYARVSNLNISNIKQALASGYPIVFGFTVYDSFESDYVAQTGLVNLPTPSEQNMGGHAVMMVGYDDATQRVLVRNSWGPGWGLGGYFTLPYAYVTSPDLATDFWTITK